MYITYIYIYMVFVIQSQLTILDTHRDFCMSSNHFSFLKIHEYILKFTSYSSSQITSFRQNMGRQQGEELKELL